MQYAVASIKEIKESDQSGPLVGPTRETQSAVVCHSW